MESIQRAAIAKHRAEVARDEEAAKTRAAEELAEQKAAAAVARRNRKAARDGSTGASGRREAPDYLQAMVEDAEAEKAKRQRRPSRIVRPGRRSPCRQGLDRGSSSGQACLLTLWTWVS